MLALVIRAVPLRRSKSLALWKEGAHKAWSLSAGVATSRCGTSGVASRGQETLNTRLSGAFWQLFREVGTDAGLAGEARQ